MNIKFTNVQTENYKIYFNLLWTNSCVETTEQKEVDRVLDPLSTEKHLKSLKISKNKKSSRAW